jgi:hypothetical protein
LKVPNGCCPCSNFWVKLKACLHWLFAEREEGGEFGAAAKEAEAEETG